MVTSAAGSVVGAVSTGAKSIRSDDAETRVYRATRYGVRLVTPPRPQRLETRKSMSVAERSQSRCPKRRVYATRTARSGTYSSPSLNAHFASPCAAKKEDDAR